MAFTANGLHFNSHGVLAQWLRCDRAQRKLQLTEGFKNPALFTPADL